MDSLLKKFKSQQDKGAHFPCPRCGANSMSDKCTRNALSRATDIHVCDLCGMDEAMRELKGNPLPIEQWWLIRAKALLDVIKG